MDAHRVSTHTDYTFGSSSNSNMEPHKHGKQPACHEERFDSGLESLKEDELVHDFEEMRVSVSEDLKHECEPWRAAVTDDGDT